MKKAIWAVATLGMITLFASITPDFFRYMRIRSM